MAVQHADRWRRITWKEVRYMAINFDKYLYSTDTHYISNSGSDENGGTKGGKAGDQTGKEVKPWNFKTYRP